MTSCLKRLLLLIATAVVCLQPARAWAQAIAVEGDHFTVDRADGTGPHPKFLLFISYFDALRATDPIGDLDYIANTLHFDGIRVLPNWQRRTSAYCPASESEPDTLFDAAGNIRGDTSPPSGPLKTLLDLIEGARARRLVVDVTFSRDTIAGLSWDDHIRAATRLSTLLKPYRNVLFDLDNEVQNHASPDPDIRRMRDAILANVDPAVADPSRVVVVSRSGGTGGVVDYNQVIGTSAIAYHDPRVSEWWDSQVPAVVAPLRLSGKPVYLQEPQAWNSGLLICGDQEPTGKDADGNAEHFRTAVARARASGAAAWTFHTRQSFRLDVGGSLRSRIQANGTEKNLLEGTETEQALSVVAATGVWPIDTTLSIDMLGTGDGTVTSNPGGINCGLAATTCSASFPVGTVVTLSSSAATGSDFAGWEGCSGTATCTVTLDTSKTVGVRFTAVQQVFYYDTDAVGSTRLVTDSHGAVVEFHNYTPFGVEVAPPTGFTPRLFAGRQRDSETTFDYFGARYLSAVLGRFTTADDASFADGADPQSWNSYGYARSNPLRFGDSTGHFSDCPYDSCVVAPYVLVDPLLLRFLWGGLTRELGSMARDASKTATDWINRPRDQNCVAGSVGIGATLGGVAGGVIGGTGGAAGGATGGTLVAPGVGTIGGGVAGAALGYAQGTGVGIVAGGAFGGALGYVMCAQGGGSGGGGRGGGNQQENRSFKEAVRRIEKALGRRLRPDQTDQLHREISKQNYTLQEIIDLGIAMFR